MSFFYDLNKKLDGIRATPEVTHQQLNERDMGKHNNATTGFKALAAKAAKEYGSKAAGERVAGAVKAKMAKAGKLEEEQVDEVVRAGSIVNPNLGILARPQTQQDRDSLAFAVKRGREVNRMPPTDNDVHPRSGAKSGGGLGRTYTQNTNTDANRTFVSRERGGPKMTHKSLPKTWQQGEPTANDGKGLEEGPLDAVKKIGKKVASGVNRLVGHGSDEDMIKDLQRKSGAPVTGKKPEQRSMREAAAPVDYEKVLEAIAALYGDDMWDNDAMGDLAQDLEQAGPTDRELDFIIAKGKLPTRLKSIRFTNTDDVQFGHLDEKSSAPMSSKQKSFAALAPPANKITFADKIAGAKKEVDEMLGDVAAEAMRSALSGGQKKIDMNKNGKLDANDFAMLRKGAKSSSKDEMAEDQPTQFEVHYKDNQKGRTAKTKVKGSDAKQAKAAWNDWNSSNTPGRFTFVAVKPVAAEMDEERSKGTAFDMNTPRAAAPKVGSIERGTKHDIKHTATGRMVTRRTDDQGNSVGADDDSEASGEKRGRGRPKGTKGAIGAKGPSGRSKLMTREGDNEGSELKAAMMLLKKSGYKVTKAVGEESTHTRDDHAEKAGKKVTKDIEYDEKKKDKKEEEVDESTTSGSVATSTATKSSGGSMVGKGIYDSMNRELENMIAESMSINMSDSTEGGKSLTITATDEDALKLGMMLKNAGLGGGDAHGGDMHSPGEEPCETCGMPDCGCGDVEQAVDENAPDWPTNTETSPNALQYSGGLNKPKADVAGNGQSTVPVVATRPHNEDDDMRRMMEMAGIKQAELEPWEQTMKEDAVTDADAAEDAADETEDSEVQEDFLESIQRMREIAGIKEAKKDVDQNGDGKNDFEDIKIARMKASGAIKDKEEKKVDESIFALTNQWKAYKG